MPPGSGHCIRISPNFLATRSTLKLRENIEVKAYYVEEVIIVEQALFGSGILSLRNVFGRIPSRPSQFLHLPLIVNTASLLLEESLTREASM